jgi:hypothetical protein
MSMLVSILKFPFVVMYRIFCALFALVFLPGAYALRGKFLRGLVVTVLIVVLSILTGGIAAFFLVPLAMADVATC